MVILEGEASVRNARVLRKEAEVVEAEIEVMVLLLIVWLRVLLTFEIRIIWKRRRIASRGICYLYILLTALPVLICLAVEKVRLLEQKVKYQLA
jgi:hypothetical protein